MTNTSRRLALRLAFSVAVAGPILSRPASAFYFQGWPGSGQPTPIALFQSPPAFEHSTEVRGEVLVPRPISPATLEVVPPGVPEPATLGLAACGLLVVAIRRRNGRVAG